MSTRARSAAARNGPPPPAHCARVDFGRDICGDLHGAEQREWLVTNGLGGFASGTVAGLLTRRYHALLVAALKPPSGRTLLVSKLDEVAEYGGQRYPLTTNRWVSGVLDPHGYRYIERFRLDGTIPVWTFACGYALLEKRVWMQRDANTTYVEYILVRGDQPLYLTVKALVNYRDFHATTRAGNWRMSIQPIQAGLRVDAFSGAVPFYLLSGEASAEAAHDWYRDFDLAVERERGLEDHEDHLHAGTFRARLQPGHSVTIVASTEPFPGGADFSTRRASEAQTLRETDVLNRWVKANPEVSREAPAWIRQLVLAADQFIVSGSSPARQELDGLSVIAGYPWFGEWGRDTMIALPGLTLTTGRGEVARSILSTWARLVDAGMIPNRLPEAGSPPEYNTADATLWFLEAMRQYFVATRDEGLLRELFPVFAEIVTAHVRGARFGIRTDPVDGLLSAGEPGLQLTWMDAKVGDDPVTPRIGKPVEVNALWYNALVTMAQFARELGKPTSEYESLAARARAGFQRFWNNSAGCCFDVLDGPQGNDPSLRPNQLFAVSLAESPLGSEQQRAIVEVCARVLLTSYGLRSLAPCDPRYRGRYLGGPPERDAAYHQGTVWGWLLGPFALAHRRVYNDASQAASFLEPMAWHLNTGGLGTASEIFDGDAPFTPRGCIAQAWTVAEVLRAWTVINAGSKAGGPS